MIRSPIRAPGEGARLFHNLQALEELPAEAIVPARIVLRLLACVFLTLWRFLGCSEYRVPPRPNLHLPSRESDVESGRHSLHRQQRRPRDRGQPPSGRESTLRLRRRREGERVGPKKRGRHEWGLLYLHRTAPCGRGRSRGSSLARDSPRIRWSVRFSRAPGSANTQRCDGMSPPLYRKRLPRIGKPDRAPPRQRRVQHARAHDDRLERPQPTTLPEAIRFAVQSTRSCVRSNRRGEPSSSGSSNEGPQYECFISKPRGFPRM